MLIFSMMPLNIVGAQEKIFKVTIIAPGNANMVRRQWGQIFANSLQQLGIDARLVFLGWSSVFDRVFTPPPDKVGKTYDEGGFDIELIGWTPGLIPEPRQLYYGGDPKFFAPEGQNYLLWNNTQSNQLLDTFITSTNKTIQDQALQAWQTVFFNEVPASQIEYSKTHALVTPELGGYDWIYFNVQPSPQWLYNAQFPAADNFTVVYASTGEIESLIPPLSNSWYDSIIIVPIFDSLAMVNNAKETIKGLLTEWNSSADGFQWTYTLRPGVKWHDLVDFTADDVLFSLWGLMNADTGSQFVGYYQSVYGNKVAFKWLNGTTTWLNSTAVGADRIGQITATNSLRVDFTLPVLVNGKPYGYVDPYIILGSMMIPKHIFEKMPPAEWTDSVFNTGVGSKTIGGTTYYGPVGTGPYKWVGYDATAQLVHLQRFDQYWNYTDLRTANLFRVKDYYIKFIADKTAAIAALKNNDVDMLDPNYQVQTEVITPGAIDPSWGKALLLEGAGRQEIGYNMRHPIFGTGVDTPLGKSTPSRAAEAARYVRQAFDYAVPRQLIIDNLLSGFGDPGATPMLPTQPYYNASITPRNYDLSKARELLQKAGYTVPGPPPPPTLPSFILGMSFVISGYFKPGNPLPNRELLLMDTTDNATYQTSSTMIGRTTTDLTSWYSFTVTPMTTGTHYYYLFDRQALAGQEWTYVRNVTVATLADAFTPFNTKIDNLGGNVTELRDQIGGLQGQVTTLTAVAAVALVAAIALGVLNFYMIRKKPK